MIRSLVYRLSMYVSGVAILAGCAAAQPYRTNLVNAGEVQCPYDTAYKLPECSNITPETTKDYELHFVEFDDQGWAAAMPSVAGQPEVKSPSQTDHLMKRPRPIIGR
jgi:hypothetical protein